MNIMYERGPVDSEQWEPGNWVRDAEGAIWVRANKFQAEQGRAWSTPDRDWERAAYGPTPSGEVSDEVPVRPLKRVPRGTGFHQPKRAPRVDVRSVGAELAEYLDLVRTDQVTFTVTADYGRHALAFLAPADATTPGRQVALSAVKKKFRDLVAAANNGESVVFCVRRRPIARLEPLSWTGDQPEPVRDPERLERVRAEATRRLERDRLSRDLTPASRAAALDLAARLAYDVIAAYARYGFTPQDMEFDPVEQAVWTALARFR